MPNQRVLAQGGSGDGRGRAAGLRWYASTSSDGRSELAQSKPVASPAVIAERRRRAAQVIGYATVGAVGRGRARQAVRLQIDRIESECERLGLSLLELVREREPQRGHALERPGLGYIVKLIGAGDAEGIAVAELSRLGQSLPELGRVLEWILRSDVRLIAASPAIDTRDEMGRLALQAVIEVSRGEQQRLVERTRVGMLAARRKGPAGIADYPELMERITRMRADGMTLQAIADCLNEEAVPTVRGGAKWRPSSVQTAIGYRRPPGERRGLPRGTLGQRTGIHA